MNTTTTPTVNLKESRLCAWLNNWTQLPSFAAQDSRPSPTDKPNNEQLKAWARVLLEAMENFVRGVIQIKGKRWTIDKVVLCECGRQVSGHSTLIFNTYEDWTVHFQCVRKNGASICIALAKSGFQLIEIQPQQLTHPLWATSHLTFQGHPLIAKIYQDTQGLSAPLQEQLLLQIATEFLQAKVWTPDFAQQWTALGPHMFLTVNPPSAPYNCLYLVAKNGGAPNYGSTCTVSSEVSETEVSTSILRALRDLAWAWTCAISHPQLGPYPIWNKQKNNAYWAFEPLTLQALANGLHLHLVAKTLAFTELLSLAPNQNDVALSLQPPPQNVHRIVFPFHIKKHWEQVTQSLRTQVDVTSFTLCTNVPQPLRPPVHSDLAWYPIEGKRPLSTIATEQALVTHQVLNLTC